MPDDETTDADRKRGYYSLLDAVRQNTGGPTVPSDQPPAMQREVLVANRVRSGYDADHVRQLIRHARDRGHLFVYREAEHTVRVCCTDRESIRNLVASENRRDAPRTELIEAATEAVGE